MRDFLKERLFLCIGSSWDKESLFVITSENCIQKFKEDFMFRLDPKTIDLYQRAIKQLLQYCEKPFEDIISRDIRNWLLHLNEKGYKPITVNAKLFGLKLFYQYCVEEKFVSNNPLNSIIFPDIEDKLPRYLEIGQLLQLRKYVEGKLQERAIVEVLYATGVRIGELAEIKKEDIDWSERIIYIRKGKRKKERIVLFTRLCEEHLKSYLHNRSDNLPFLFVNKSGTRKVCIRTIQGDFSNYRQQLHIEITPHTLRHTFAAHLAIKGMPIECVQVLLGHEKPNQTHLYARLYHQARKEKYDEWM
ncbi:tyrosine-type recombinase/integrase [Metabacillus litoralis]|uniref:Tyrosine-type recombinase/integrase n=1 Tax=Metabacillus litoralis TaxID=152268 RepID=A0A5C6V047_9BACI|nr:tyrosine-type recombinase/integrase [Metabacillus litoralis]